MKSKITCLLIFPLSILGGCGATWDVTRYDGLKFSEKEHAKDKFECQTFARATYTGNTGTIGADLTINDTMIDCMRARGWRYTKTGTTLF